MVTPQFSGQWLDDQSVYSLLDDKASKFHSHSTSDISDIARCVGPVMAKVCMNDDSSLQVQGVTFVPAPLIGGLPIRLEYVTGIKTGASNLWNTIGNISAGNKVVRHVEGSVKSIQGTDQQINSSDRVRLRIVDRRIEEFHTEFALNNQDVLLIVHYTNL